MLFLRTIIITKSLFRTEILLQLEKEIGIKFNLIVVLLEERLENILMKEIVHVREIFIFGMFKIFLI